MAIFLKLNPKAATCKTALVDFVDGIVQALRLGNHANGSNSSWNCIEGRDDCHAQIVKVLERKLCASEAPKARDVLRAASRSPSAFMSLNVTCSLGALRVANRRLFSRCASVR